MQIIIGGSPSTGSSLLRQMLNRHSAIYCGPETKLFAFPALYDDWEKLKYGLVRKPYITAPDVHLVRGANLSGPEQKWSADEVAALVEGASSLPGFAEAYFERPCFAYGKLHWAEKTPANVLGFRHFHHHFTDPVIVHIVRHPLDTIASLLSRGLPLFQAVSRYLYSTAYGLAARDLDSYVQIKYEHLVNSPEEALSGFFEKSGLEFENAMLSKGNPEMTETEKMEGWTHSETDLPSVTAVGRFRNLTKNQQSDILQAVACLSINSRFAGKHTLPVKDIPTISEMLDYELPEDLNVSNKMRRRLARSRLARMMFALAERRAFMARERPIDVR